MKVVRLCARISSWNCSIASQTSARCGLLNRCERPLLATRKYPASSAIALPNTTSDHSSLRKLGSHVPLQLCAAVRHSCSI